MKIDNHPLWAFGKWVGIAALVGSVAGLAGVAFHFTLTAAASLFDLYGWLLFGLPMVGILIRLLYRRWDQQMDQGKGTNMVIAAVRSNEPVRAITAPLIFISTALTHLVGGSAGREGAALQLGGSLGCQLGQMLKLDEKDSRVAVMCGMSAAFAALFGTPLTAAVFSLEVVSVGVMYYSAIVPCTLASLLGFLLAGAWGIIPTAFRLLEVPTLSLLSLGRTALLGMLCALVSILFCRSVHESSRFLKRYVPNVFKRSLLGGTGLLVLTLLVGSRDYNGAGTAIIARAMEGNVLPPAFLLKLIFTTVTLSTGYKGGEIVPVFFIGATFGCLVGPYLGLGASFAAGLGLVAVFCGVTNCPITSIILSVELFGAQGLLLFATVCAVSYMLSGYEGLYSEQKIMYSKLKAEFLDRQAK